LFRNKGSFSDSRALTGKIGKNDRRHHEHYGCGNSHLAQKSGSSGTSEDGLAGPPTEYRSNIRTLAGLQKNDENQCDAHYNVND